MVCAIHFQEYHSATEYKAVEVSLVIHLQSVRIWEKQIPAILSLNDMENLYIINY
jgi:DUF1365 family protein